MKISVIICTYNRPVELNRLIKSILSCDRLDSVCEILIIDASDQDTFDHSLFTSSIHVHKMQVYKTKPHLTYQRNFGVSKASGDVCVFFDDDTEISRNYFDAIIFNYSNYKIVGCGGGTVDPVNKETDKLSPFWWYPFSILFFLPTTLNRKFRLSGLPNDKNDFTQRCMVQSLNGGNMSFLKNVLQKEPFDEKLEAYCWGEDDDISYRVSRHGKLLIDPDLTIIHYTTDTQRMNKKEELKMILKYHSYLFHKNFNRNYFQKIAYRLSIVGFKAEYLLKIL